MSELNELYQEVILDHTKKPRNYGRLDNPDRQALGHNPLCGDRLTLQLKTAGDRIQDLRFEGAGCSIFKSSASLMTEAVKGHTRAEVDAIFERFHRLVTKGPAGEDLDDMGSLAAFSGVHEFPVRVKCASLAWHTLKAAFDAKPGAVTTE